MPAGPRVAILGAGSVGCFIGGAWACGGVEVTFLGRHRLSEELSQHGLTLSDYAGWERRLAPGEFAYTTDPGALASAQLIAVTVKSADTPIAAAQIAEHGREGATVVSFQNGVSNLDTLEQQLSGRFEVVRGMVPFNVAYLGAGRFHKGVAGDLYAEPCSQTRTLAEAVANGPAALRLSEGMLSLAWGKLLINLNNAVNALSGRSLQEELMRRGYRDVFAESMREGLAILKAAGIAPSSAGPVALPILPRILRSPDWLFTSVFLKRWKIDAKARSSMADDLDAGRRTEVDYLNGELVRLADRLGQPAPVNRKIVELVHQAERGAPPLSAAHLRQAVLGA